MGPFTSPQVSAPPGLMAQLQKDIENTRHLEHAVMELEDAVYAVLESNKGDAFHDVDFLYWDRTLKNIATPISMALSEYKGPRRFHYHYRHDPVHTERMLPVYEAPLGMLIRVVRDAQTRCNEMVGVSEARVARLKHRLEHTLKLVLSAYNNSLL